MVKCDLCSKEAVFYDRKRKLCKDHFLEFYRKKVLETIRKFDLIEEGEKIGVAVSGGKDSTALYIILSELKEELNIEVVGILIDEGIKNYREHTIEFLKKVRKEVGTPVYVFRFKDFFGMTLDEMVEIEKELKPCTICGVFRRYLLNYASIKLRIDKLATAHTINDEVQTFFMDLIKNNIKDIKKMGPKTGVSEIKGFVIRVKPFYFVFEKENMTFMLLRGYFPPLHECPYAPLGQRWNVRFTLYDLEKNYPGFHKKMANFIVKFTKRFKEEKVKLNPCKVCGYPTSRKICKACEIRKRLNLEFKEKGYYEISSL